MPRKISCARKFMPSDWGPIKLTRLVRIRFGPKHRRAGFPQHENDFNRATLTKIDAATSGRSTAEPRSSSGCVKTQKDGSSFAKVQVGKGGLPPPSSNERQAGVNHPS